MSNAVKELSLTVVKAPMKFDGELFILLHPSRIAVVCEIRILARRKDNNQPYFPNSLYIKGDDIVKYPLEPSTTNESVYLYKIPIADLKDSLEALDEVSEGVSDD